MRYLLPVIAVLLSVSISAQRTVISGTVTEASSGETLAGVNVYLPDQQVGVQTNTYGFYSLATKKASERIVFSYLGYRSDTLICGGDAGANVDVQLEQTSAVLTMVEVGSSEGSAHRSYSSLERLSLQRVEELPVLLGEKDVFKGLQLLPGVSNPREGFGGLFVRGGSPDQNLILLDGAPVYNAFHLFGFLSVFNADALKSVSLYKGDYPARFGGRIASVVDVRMKEGNRKEWHGAGGIGLLTSRLTLEGPIGKKKNASILVSGRRTYADLLLGLATPKGERRKLYFYDGNFKVNYQLPRGDKLYLSGYFGRDDFGNEYTYREGTERDGFNWGNRTLTARWNRPLGQRAYLNVTALNTKFDFGVVNEEIVRDTVYSLEYLSGIEDVGMIVDVDVFLNARHSLRVGGAATHHNFTLSAIAQRSADEAGTASAERVSAGEYAIYVEDEYQVHTRLKLNYGLRFSYFAPDGGSTYSSLEPRISLDYAYRPQLRLLAGYSRTAQYLHLLSNSGPGLPTSLWVPASERITPQRGQQWSLGASYGPPAERWSVTAGAYYRSIRDLIGYRNGATFLLLDVFNEPGRADRVDLLDNVTSGDGHAYGLELAADYRGERGRASFAYTLARIRSRLNGVNNFDYFAASQDRRHDINLSGSYRWRPNLLLTASWTFGSGVPTTIPTSIYSAPPLPGFNNTRFDLDHYTERNGYRMPAVHRLDIALQWKRHPKWGEAYWELGFYNAYARANPFFVDTRYKTSGIRVLTKTALFPLVPSLGYHFKF